MKTALSSDRDYSQQIAQTIRDAILNGDLPADGRLPSEAELATRFSVSRPTVREALKRLAAQNLIRTQRGATGGAFVNRLSFAQAQEHLTTTAMLLLSMNRVDFETACEARFALQRACLPMAVQRRSPAHLAAMQAEIARQSSDGLSDEGFCASDVAFHRALIDAAGNPVLSWHLAGAVEAMQPLMNMITFSARSRARIIALHQALVAALQAHSLPDAQAGLDALAAYTLELGGQIRAHRALQASGSAAEL
ncbi:MAG: FadR family transcriptional regulator [Roseinatronobacter sp.]|nr:MAG: FadR family transcriptional regulator [Roseinatronobacter sp.]